MSKPQRFARKGALAGLAALTLMAASAGSAEQASARPFHPINGGYRGHHRGIGVGAAVGLGVLGAAVAGVAASQYYNGYPVYQDGGHRGYGYDYYPDHGGYYGPY